MGKLRRRDVELLEAVNRAVAFDRTVDRARVYSPSLFPPEITCKKYILDDSACKHAFHHRALGELGPIRIEDRSESTHIGGLVTGDTENPLHAERDALFRPLMEKFARADNRRCFQGKHMQCERCGAIAASLIFIDGTERCDFEDCARMMYPEYSRGTAPVWIIGPPARAGPSRSAPPTFSKSGRNASPCGGCARRSSIRYVTGLSPNIVRTKSRSRAM